MGIVVESTYRLSINRALQGLNSEVQQVVLERYHRILPVLLRLLRPQDIRERNRTWPGVSPTNKGATRLLLVKCARQIRLCIKEYAANSNEDRDELWLLLRAYCQYGPIGLIDVLPTSLPLLISEELQDCATFHRLAKHPRSDAGIYIRQILEHYAENLGQSRLPKFVARYAFATNARYERWFFDEGPHTALIPKTHRRLNLSLTYPHQSWRTGIAQLPFRCRLAERHPILVTPWLTWLYDVCTKSLMGVRLTATHPTSQDVLLTLRWSIWHYGMPTWKARGAPDVVIVPSGFHDCKTIALQALFYTHTHITVEDHDLAVEERTSADKVFIGFPESFKSYLDRWSLSLVASPRSTLPTLSECLTFLLDYVHTDTAEMTFISPTPSVFAAFQVSLPWSTGIASALYLPPGHVQAVTQGEVELFGVPFDAAGSGLTDGTIVDVRYDPDDARSVYLIHAGHHVTKASASAFEGERRPWLELVADPSLLGIHV